MKNVIFSSTQSSIKHTIYHLSHSLTIEEEEKDKQWQMARWNTKTDLHVQTHLITIGKNKHEQAPYITQIKFEHSAVIQKQKENCYKLESHKSWLDIENDFYLLAIVPPRRL